MAEEAVLDAADIIISYPDELPAGPGKVVKRDIRETLYLLRGDVGRQHTVIVPFTIQAKAPAGKTVKIEFEIFLANIEMVRGGPEKVVKKISIGSGTFDATGDTTHGAFASHDNIKDLVVGAPGADQLGTSNRYGVMIVARQLAKDDAGEWTRFFPGSKTYKSIFVTRAVTAPALSSDNSILKP